MSGDQASWGGSITTPDRHLGALEDLQESLRFSYGSGEQYDALGWALDKLKRQARRSREIEDIRAGLEWLKRLDAGGLKWEAVIEALRGSFVLSRKVDPEGSAARPSNPFFISDALQPTSQERNTNDMASSCENPRLSNYSTSPSICRCTFCAFANEVIRSRGSSGRPSPVAEEPTSMKGGAK